MGQKLEEAGYPDMSSAVRPMAITRNERKAFLQVSFFHGFVEYDLVGEKVLGVYDLPIRNDAVGLPREQYLLDSAHHGIALSGDQKTLCVAGTMSDYVAMVRRSSLRAGELDSRIFEIGAKPYWATTSRDGKRCYVSWSGTDNITIFDYAKRKVVATVPVGNHPQRVRTGDVRKGWIKAQR
jgi:YVTN family beta-propeller protein